MKTTARTIRVAAAQLPARSLVDAASALDDITAAAHEAAQAGSDLLVLPECCYPCYWLGSKERYFLPNILHSEQVETFVANLARKHQMHIAAGLVHEQDNHLYDAAVLFDAAGRVLARHHKTFLWDREHTWFAAGDSVQPAESVLGRIGMVVCAEGRSPEVFASHAALGAHLLAMPTAWVNAASIPGTYYNPQPDFMVTARAKEFGLAIVCANKFGRECDEASFCGMSLIVGPDGEALAKAPPDETTLLTAEVPLCLDPRVLVDATAHRLVALSPVRPPADAAPVKIAMLPSQDFNANGGHGRLAEWLPKLRSSGVTLVAAGTAAHHKWAALQCDGAIRMLTTQDAGKTIRFDHVQIGCVTAAEARSFAMGRLFALDGMQVLCVLGDPYDLGTLRIRAVENRVFVLAVSSHECVAIGPSGAVLASTSADDSAAPLIVELDIAQAANKLVAAQTDIWAERRPHAYNLSSPRAAE